MKPASAHHGQPGLGEAREALQRIWGYRAFRGLQEDVIADVLAGRDVMAVLPTGGGKSLCYQIPSILRAGVGLVVSPLIALMNDQVAALNQWGVAAERLDSTKTEEERAAIMRRAGRGELDLLYVSPEGLASPGLQWSLQQLAVSLIAIDEAHCVSQWGHDFRPDYRRLGMLRTLFPDVPRIAVTATADERTRADMRVQLALEGARVHVASFDRPNLALAAEPRQGKGVERVLELIAARPRGAGIVYALSRARTEALAEAIEAAGRPALAYHAGLPKDVREERQRVFLESEDMVMAATVAFGMGVDKPDIRFVIHADAPKSIEAYWQEVGRGGRDGEPAEGVALFAPADMHQYLRWIEQSEAAEEIKSVQAAKTRQLFGFLAGAACRRQTIRRYFGEAGAEPCGACDICRDPGERFDITTQAQKAASAVVRLGQRYGRERVVDHLLGVAKDEIGERHSDLSTFGVGADTPRSGWREVIDQLALEGVLDMGEDPTRPVLRIADAEAARRLFKGEARVWARRDPARAPEPRRARERGARASARTMVGGAAGGLYEALKAWRLEEARAQGVPPYVVFHDKTLAAIAEARPSDLERLGRVSGVGSAKLGRYGEAVLEVVARAD